MGENASNLEPRQDAETPLAEGPSGDAASTERAPEPPAGDGLDEPAEPDGPFAAVRARLDEIAQEVAREDISLDAALDLYEEAVKLGTKATDLLEERTS